MNCVRRQRSGRYREFLSEVERAQAESEVRDVLTITRASENNWQAAAWRLERRFPARWGRKLEAGSGCPGGWFTIEGTNLIDVNIRLRRRRCRSKGGTMVTVNGQIARLNYVDTGQINAEMPPDMPVGSSMVVTTKVGSSKSASVQIVPAMPEIFQYGANRAVAQNAPAYTLNAPDNAIPTGGSLAVYFTGGGLVTGDRRTGVPAPLTTLMQANLTLASSRRSPFLINAALVTYLGILHR